MIVATGILHTSNISPEKTLRNLEHDTIKTVMEVNYIGPSLVGKYCAKHRIIFVFTIRKLNDCPSRLSAK